MNKIAIDEVESVLLEHKVKEANSIMNELQRILDELKEEKEKNKEERPKWEYVVVLNDTLGKLTKEQENELSAYVVQQEEGEDSGIIFSKIDDAAKVQNEQTKRKNSKLENFRDKMEGLKPKFLKEKKLKIRTKESVRILIRNNG